MWVDRNVVHFLTTMHCAKPHTTVKRTAHDGRKEDRECPPCVPDYQKYMRGVDRGDQLVGYYNSGRRSVKWWRRVFTFIVEASILNAFILDGFRLPHDEEDSDEEDSDEEDEVAPPEYLHHRDSLHFRLALATELIGNFSNRQRVGHPPVTSSLRRNWSTPHLPESAPKAKRCSLCTIRGVRCETKIQCTVCKVHLCVNALRSCFKEYHTLPQLR